MNEYQMLLDLVRQTFAGVVWTHKIQEKQADIYNERCELIETVNIAVVSITACGLVSLLFTDQFWVKIGTSFLSLMTIAISVYDKTFNLRDLGARHKIAANKLISVRNELLQIIADLHVHQESVETINSRYQKIAVKLNTVYSEIPTTTTKAVKRASEALKTNEEFTYSEEEIDRFLPPTLRGRLK